jgi:LPS export ABC transporter permease LptG/LPS export ABC transporter permease LptF
MRTTIDRYVIRETIGPFCLALGIFTFVLAVRPMLNYSESLLSKGVPAQTVGFLLMLLLPSALGLTLPMAFLSALMMAFGRLSGDRETVALLACGVNPIRLLRPALFMGLVAALMTGYVMIELLPDSNQKFREITAQFLRQTGESNIKPQMFYEGFPQKVILVRSSKVGGGWEGVLIADTSQPGRIGLITAEQGRLVLDQQKLIVNLVLQGVSNYVPSDEEGVFTVGAAKESVLQIDPKAVFPSAGGITRGLAEMTITDLQAQREQKIREGLSPHNEILYMHQKFSFPVACIVFALLAVAFGFHTRKEGKLAGMTIGLGVIFLYYGCMEFSESGTKSATHWFDPHWSRWFPNLVLGAIGLIALWWRARATGQELSLRLPSWMRRRQLAAAGGVVSPAGAGARSRVVLVIRFPRLSFPRPKLLDLYVSKSFLRIISLALFALMGLYYIGTVIDLSDKLFKGQADGWLLAQYLWYSTPRFFFYVVPIATLVAVLGTIGGMTRSSELTVMRACGVSLYRSALPLLVLGILSSGMLFMLEERVLAEANKKADELDDIIHDRPHHTTNLLNRSWLIGTNDRIYYYEFFDPRAGELKNLTVFQPATQPFRLVNQLHTPSAKCPDLACLSGEWSVQSGYEQRFVAGQRPVRRNFSARTISLNPFLDFTLAQVDASMMKFNELRDYTRRSKASGFNTTEAEVDLQSKLAVPAATLVMTALAVPFAVTTGRRGALYGIGLAILLSVGYFLLMAFFSAAGKAGVLPPALAAWATNVIFTAAAVYMVLTVRT